MADYQFARSDFIGNALCLDFANTAGWHASYQPTEHLNSYSDLVAWAKLANLVDQPQAERLWAEAAKRLDEAALVLGRAVAFREALYRLFSAIAAGHRVPDADVEILNRELNLAPAYLKVRAASSSFDVDWRLVRPTLDGLLAPIAWSAGRLLESDQLERVKECEGKRCGWLFLDTTRNHSRRWCLMSDCGSRAKAKRYYRRHKQ